jgi:hypothetical protein
MEIKRIIENKDNFMDLLLLGDEQENMIKKYVTTHPKKNDCTNFQNKLKCINELSEPGRV